MVALTARVDEAVMLLVNAPPGGGGERTERALEEKIEEIIKSCMHHSAQMEHRYVYP